jgi:soluble lytic murein transglycosylase-like protein
MRTGLLALVAMSVASFSVLPADAAKAPHHAAHRSAHLRRHAQTNLAIKAPTGAEVDAIRVLIAKHAAENGVPFELADAVARIESTYKPHASSSAGALGLMQIKPGTAHDVGFAGSANELYDAETNIRFGVKFLAQVYRKSGGDLCGTVMRYESGAYATRMNAANRAYCSKARAIMARG